MKKFLLITLISALAVIGLIYSLGYHGNRSFAGGGNLPPVNNVIEKAKDLKGTPYDPLMGMYDNIGASAGFIVCSDIPNIAYGLAGYSWQQVLKKDFSEHPDAYNTADNNNPRNPYFHRRARNLHAYFNANNRLMPSSYKPVEGDLIFYRKTPNGYVAHVALVTAVSETGYKLMESAPKTIIAQEVDHVSPINRGWIFAGFGSVYSVVY